MIRVFLLILVAISFVQPCFGSIHYMGDKDLAEVKRMKGIAVATLEGGRASYYHRASESTELVVFVIGWLPDNELLGKGLIEKFLNDLRSRKGGFAAQNMREEDAKASLASVELHGTDRMGRTVFVTPLMFQEFGGGELGEQFSGEYHTRIEFSINKHLVERSFLRFYERFPGPLGGRQFTDVYLGKKPERPVEVPFNEADKVEGVEPLPGVLGSPGR